MAYLDKRNEHYGADLKITPEMLNRAEIKSSTDVGTDITVQEVINAFCDLLDGQKDHDIADMVGEEIAPRVIEMRAKLRQLWTLPDGTKVIG